MGAFLQAIRNFARRRVLPTRLGSDELEALDASTRARSVFSARVWQVDVLQTIREQITRLVGGEAPAPGEYTNPATVRQALRETLDRIDYQPDQPGTIQDLRSEARLNLIVRTNEQMATGYAQRELSLDPDTLEEWPAWELVRIEDRVDKRTWVQRWRAAGGQVFPGSPGGLPLEPGFSEGRLIALKTDSVWESISRFGHPHPPFDFNSGVGVQDVDRATTDALGLTSGRAAVAAASTTESGGYPADVSASAPGLDPDLRALLAAEGYGFDGDRVYDPEVKAAA